MKKSNYFFELLKTYLVELDDLMMDSGGKKVLQKRLDEKRGAIDALLQMLEYSPEMVAVIFYGAFDFKLPKVMRQLALIDPDELDLPEWAELEQSLVVEAWAQPLIAKALDCDGGDAFMVCVAALEFMRTHDRHTEPSSNQATDDESNSNAEERDEARDEDSDDESNNEDLGESGHNWLEQQGFDTRED